MFGGRGDHQQWRGPARFPRGGFGGPRRGFDGPPRGFNGPPGRFSRPPGRFDGPQNRFDGPPNRFDGPPGRFNRPPGRFNGPQRGFARPRFDGPPQPQEFDQPRQRFDGPPRGFSGPPRGFGGPQRGFRGNARPPFRFEGPRGPRPQLDNQHVMSSRESVKPETHPSEVKCEPCNVPFGSDEQTYRLHLLSDDHQNRASRFVPSTSGGGPDTKPETRTENEPQFDDDNVVLDSYNSDLNLEIMGESMCSAKAMSERGFAYLWAGVRGTYGATKGKVVYEVSVDANQPTDHLEFEPNPHVLRCGWSLDSSSLQLGTEPFSYGFGGTGKASVNNRFFNFGRPYGVGDVIGCYLDLTVDPVIMCYTVNGIDMGVAFRIPQSELAGRTLFPHIMTKNQDFTVNFGQMSGPMSQVVQGFSHIGQLDASDGLQRATIAPKSRAECEVLMMVGLPGCGKTHFANELVKKLPEKRYNILGTNSLIEKMKVMGLARQRNYSERWDVLISKCTECFHSLVKIAGTKKRNYILDQTNVYPTSRMKKMKDFQGFDCKTIVIVPKDDEFMRRCRLRRAEDGIDIPEKAIMDMKANFVLPDVEETYGKAYYSELNPADSYELVQQYNAEAHGKGTPMTKGVSDYVRRNALKRSQAGASIQPGYIWSLGVHTNMKQEPMDVKPFEPQPGTSRRSPRRERPSDPNRRSERSRNERRRSTPRRDSGDRSNRRSRSRDRSNRRSRSRERSSDQNRHRRRGCRNRHARPDRKRSRTRSPNNRRDDRRRSRRSRSPSNDRGEAPWAQDTAQGKNWPNASGINPWMTTSGTSTNNATGGNQTTHGGQLNPNALGEHGAALLQQASSLAAQAAHEGSSSSMWQPPNTGNAQLNPRYPANPSHNVEPQPQHPQFMAGPPPNVEAPHYSTGTSHNAEHPRHMAGVGANPEPRLLQNNAPGSQPAANGGLSGDGARRKDTRPSYLSTHWNEYPEPRDQHAAHGNAPATSSGQRPVPGMGGQPQQAYANKYQAERGDAMGHQPPLNDPMHGHQPLHPHHQPPGSGMSYGNTGRAPSKPPNPAMTAPPARFGVLGGGPAYAGNSSIDPKASAHIPQQNHSVPGYGVPGGPLGHISQQQHGVAPPPGYHTPATGAPYTNTSPHGPAYTTAPRPLGNHAMQAGSPPQQPGPRHPAPQQYYQPHPNPQQYQPHGAMVRPNPASSIRHPGPSNPNVARPMHPPPGNLQDSQGGQNPAAPGGATGSSTPDYTALLKYLQYYQKQMGSGGPEGPN